MMMMTNKQGQSAMLRDKQKGEAAMNVTQQNIKLSLPLTSEIFAHLKHAKLLWM